jgi:hypothetical protein
MRHWPAPAAGPACGPQPCRPAGAELAKELRGYAERADQTAEFAAWAGKVRTDNTRRWALQNEFDLARLPR